MVVSDFIHPYDAETLRDLNAISAFPSLVRKVYEMGLEDIMWSNNITTNIRLSENQFPNIYRLLPPICDKLGIPIPELYLNTTPYLNSWTSGNKRVYIVITLGLIRRLSEDELTAVIAHECGHIICNHVIYSTLAEWLFSLGETISDSEGVEKVIGTAVDFALLKSIRLKLNKWHCASELSADRVGCYITSATTMVQALAKVERIPPIILKDLELREWAKQGEDYEKLREGNTWKKTVRWLANADLDHPYGPVRAYEAYLWEQSQQFGRLSSGRTCPNCGAAVSSDWKFCRRCGTLV